MSRALLALVLCGYACDESDAPPIVAADRVVLDVATPIDGVDCAHFNAKIVAREGDEVLPETTVHLEAAMSPGGRNFDFRWSVIAPRGTVGELFPSDRILNPSLIVDVDGDYFVRLDAFAPQETTICASATKLIRVVSPPRVAITLDYATPGPDGSARSVDLDLHLTHANADAWFDPRWDCSAYNAAPSWDADGEPANGAVASYGPSSGERIDLRRPIAGCYAIGVHHAGPDDANATSPTFATVRVYVDGGLRFAANDVALVVGDLWRVAGLCWGDDDATLSAPPELDITHGVLVPDVTN